MLDVSISSDVIEKGNKVENIIWYKMTMIFDI